MLQLETLPGSLSGLLSVFRCCFTAPTFRTFVALVSGLVARPARRTVCGMLIGAGLSRTWHHSRAHRFFAGAKWSVDAVGLVLLRLIRDLLLAPDAPVVVAVDDTLFRRSGRRVHAARWHHDGSAKGPKDNRIGWGNCWVIAGVVVELAFLDRAVCLPVAFALWPGTKNGKNSKNAKNGEAGASKQVIASQLIERIAAACPGRTVHVVADAWYAGTDGKQGAARGATRRRGLPTGVTLTSRLRRNATLTEIAIPVPGAPGRPRHIGDKIGTPAALAERAQWTPTTVRRYGSVDHVQITELTCLWYGVYRSRAIRVILIRDHDATTGYAYALITTDLTTPAEQIIARYATRWSIEVAIEDAKQTTGVGEARNRTAAAVERTVPFGLITQSLTVIWYAQHGHSPDIAAQRRAEARWYPSKTQPAYLDMITTLRRVLIAARFRGGRPDQPTPSETQAILTAWAEAAA